MKNRKLASQMVEAHSNGRYPTVVDSTFRKFYVIAEKDKTKAPEEKRAIFFPTKDDFSIKRDSDEARFFWQDTRENYFDKFVSKGEVPLYQINQDAIIETLTDEKGRIKSASVIGYGWFYWPELDSLLSFWYRYLDYVGRAFGVLRSGAEGGAELKKISQEEKLVLPYTTQDLEEAEKEVERLSKYLQSTEIENLSGLLKKLKQ